MGTTPKGLFPYPEAGDAVNVHGDIKRLADRIETAVRGTAITLADGTNSTCRFEGHRFSSGGSWASYSNGAGEDILLEQSARHPDGSNSDMVTLRCGISGMSGSGPGTAGVQVQVYRTTGTTLRIVGARTIGTGASNVRMNADGELARETSSRRYKKNIAPMADEQISKVLDLKPITYRIKDPQDGDDGTRDHPGLIAEDVDAVDPAYVVRNEAGQADGLMYDRLVVPLIGLVQRQQKQIDALEARVAALEAG